MQYRPGLLGGFLAEPASTSVLPQLKVVRPYAGLRRIRAARTMYQIG
jgi:hypothetical protein